MPECWEFVRLSTLCWLEDIKISKGERLPYLDAKTLRGKSDKVYLTEGKIVDSGMKVILVDGENSGEVFDIQFRGYMGSTFKKLAASIYVKYQYLNIVLDFYRDLFKGNKIGAAIPHLNKKLFKSLIVGLPPIAEQQRIIVAIENVEPLIPRYADLEQQSTKLDNEIYDKLKKSILQYAIQGKLVAQDPNDEPASVLLERIRAEKKAQLGKKYVDSYIYKGDDNCYYEKIGNNEPVLLENLPFEIPDSWAWARLGNYITLLSGRDLEPTRYNNAQRGIPYITGASNFINGNLIVNRWTDSPVVRSCLGDLLITCKGTIGEMAQNNVGDLHIARQVMAINTNLNIQYVNIYLKTKITTLQASAKSIIPGISRTDIEKALIPIPPMEEQLRIVDKMRQILTEINKDEN